MAKYCKQFDRSFGSQQALNQHLNSRAVYRYFDSQQSLDQHLGPPAHARCTNVTSLTDGSQSASSPVTLQFEAGVDVMTLYQFYNERIMWIMLSAANSRHVRSQV
jgi:hypothetical protein